MNVHIHDELDTAQREAWSEFWLNCQHSHPRQHLAFSDIERAKGRKPFFLIGEENGSIVSIGLFSLRPLLFGGRCSFEAVCLRGPAFDNIDHGRDFLLQVILLFQSLRVGSIRLSPAWYFPEADPVESLLKEMNFKPCSGGSRGSTGLVDLRKSNEEIFSAFSKNTRKQARLAEKLGVSIHPVTSFKDAQLAFRCLQSMRSDRGIIPLSSNEFQVTFDVILKNEKFGILHNAIAGSTFLGALWNINGTHISHGWGYAIEQEASAKLSSSLTIGPALFLKAFIWAKEQGCKWFDLEGPVEDTDNPINQFKRRFSPTAIERINEHVYICNHAIHFISKGYDSIQRIKRAISRLPYQINKRFASPMQKRK